MEQQVNRLVEKTWAKFQELDPSRRLLIGISGIPGSGKTTLAATLTTRLNTLYSQSTPPTPHAKTPIATFVPMDGYHLSRAQLDSMADPKHAHDRRGAAFTFDGTSFLGLVRKIREPLASGSETLYAPSFDHALKDPVEDGIPISPTSRVVVFEGNYLSLNTEPWLEAGKLMDELWFVEVDFEMAGGRLVPRHLKAGIAADVESAWKRVRENDLVNGEEVVKGRVEVDEIIMSRNDDNWAPKDAN